MIGLLAPVVLAAAAAWLRSGSLAGLHRLRIRWWPVAIASICAQLVLHNPPFNQQAWALAFGPALWMACLAGMLAVVLRNAVQPGPARVAFLVAALGLALNVVVITANGGYMPQSSEARIAARGSALAADANLTELYNVTPAGPDTRLAWLGDVIPQPSWLPRANVISLGDVILSLALAGLLLVTIGRRDTQLKENPADI